MEWPKVKNIIILILLLINGFLLILVGSQQRRVRLYERSALTQAAEILAQNGITVSQSALEQAAANSLPVLSSSRDLEAEAVLAKTLLGENAACTDQSAGLYIYSSDAGTAIFRSSGDFQINLSNCLVSDVDFAGHAARLLDSLGLEAELLEQQVMDTGAATVTFRQLLNGIPLYSCQIEFEYSTTRLLTVSGTLLAVEAVPSGDSDVSLDLPTTLIRFLDNILELGDVCSAVTGLRLGYRSTQSSGGSIRLTPMWLVATNISDYYLDGLTGELSRAS